jgi:hypothetical protein
MKFNPFRPKTTKEHNTQRWHTARRLAEHHRQQEADMADHATWATARAEGHKAMAEMYEQRAKELSNEDLAASTS